ncbi:hypothetical protein AB3M89_01805 [Microbacterium sp. 179-I 3D2 NHS]|uniref:hypothetical protein n=1 Tax=Microbacterium sp. 179-I 3D2 NHS TaxID=3235178 RepID=UPI0039A179CA
MKRRIWASSLAVASLLLSAGVFAVPAEGARAEALPTEAVSSVAATGQAASGESVLWDPGPSNRCWSVIDEREHGHAPQVPLSQAYENYECGLVEAAAASAGASRHDPNASYTDSKTGQWASACWPNAGAVWFTNAKPSCPSWRFNTFGWLPSQRGTVPGFDHWVEDMPDGGLKLTLKNNAAALSPAGTAQWSAAAGGERCSLKESSFSYDYAPGALKKFADRVPRISDGLVFEMTAEVTQPPTAYTCGPITVDGVTRDGEKRGILTTDLIWTTPNPLYVEGSTTPGTTDPDYVHLISVVHYNDNGWGGSGDANGVLWHNECEETKNGVTFTAGCRITIPDPNGYMTAYQPENIRIDFTAIAEQYAQYFDMPAGQIHPETYLRSVQVVTSGRGSDITASLHSIDLTKGN